MRYWKIHAIGLAACLLAYRGEAVAAPTSTPDPATRAHSYAVLRSDPADRHDGDARRAQLGRPGH